MSLKSHVIGDKLRQKEFFGLIFLFWYVSVEVFSLIQLARVRAEIRT